MTVELSHSHVGALQFTPMARPEFYPNIYYDRDRLVQVPAAFPSPFAFHLG